jgi:hypothetical protein
MQGNGWIKIHRDIYNHWTFKDSNYLKGWMTLLLKANHSDVKTLFEYRSGYSPEVVTIKRGDVLLSYKKFGFELGWSASKVKRFLVKLQKDEMIVIHNEKRWTHVTILNYDTYQYTRHTTDTPPNQKRHDTENNIRMNKKVKNEKKTLSQKEQLTIISKDIQGFKSKFPNANIQLEFDRMSDWLLSSGKKYKNYKAFFNNWLRKASHDSGAEENKTIYSYRCVKCNKIKMKSEYKDIYVSCCDEKTVVEVGVN